MVQGVLPREDFLAAVEEAQRDRLGLQTTDRGEVRREGAERDAAPSHTAEPATEDLGEPESLADFEGRTVSGSDIRKMVGLVLEAAGLSDADGRPEAGYPSLMGGGKASAYDRTTDSHGIIRTPPWATLETNEAIDSAINYNPDIAHAKWVMQLLGLNQWELRAYRLGPDGPTEEPDEDALAEARRFSKRVFLAYGGGIDAMLEVALASVLHRGAVAPELDVADSLDDVLDVDFVDATAVNFKVERDGRHRRVFPVYQEGGGAEAIPFHPLSFCYFGINKNVGRPHGQSPFLPVVETVPRQKRLRRALERVVGNHAFSRMAFTLDWEKVARSAPEDTVRITAEGNVQVVDWDKFAAFMTARRTEVQQQAEQMYEDDIWTAYDSVKPDSIGAKHAGESMNAKDLAELFDTDTIVSAHGQPAMHGRGYGKDLSSTGQVQWIVAALGIEAVREYPARAVEFILNAWARIAGIPAHFELEFPEVRKEDRKAEAEAGEIETRTAVAQRDQGWISDDEAAMRVVGHEAVEEPAPAPEPPAPEDEPEPEVEPEDDEDEPDPAEDADENARPNRAGALDHTVGCACAHCKLGDEASALAAPFEPETPDAASAIELGNAHRFGEDELEAAVDAFNDLARRITPTWVGLLEAVEVREDAPDGGQNALGIGGLLDPRPRSDWTRDAWQWDSRIARYRYRPSADRQLGRIVPQDRVRRVLDRHLHEAERQARGLAGDLVAGRITPRDFQRQMADLSARAHMQARAMAVGGQDQATLAVRTRAWDHYRQDMRYLGEFGQQIARGELSDAQIRHRSGQYFKASVTNDYEEAVRWAATRAGYTEEIWVLGATDHCPGCIDQADRGWVALGHLPDIGTQPCKSGCGCYKQQRHSADSVYPPLGRDG